jgi:hypothetical protein
MRRESDYEYFDDADFEQEDDGQEILDDLLIPEVDWAEDIKKIENDDLRQEEIQKAEKLLKEDKALRDRLDRGEIELNSYVLERQNTIFTKMGKARTRCGLKSVGVTYDDLGDLAEDSENLLSSEKGMNELKERLKDTIEDIGPDTAEELADRMHNEKKLSKDTYDRISRQIRLHRHHNK